MKIKFSREDYQGRLTKLFEKEEVKAYTMAILSFFALSFFTLFAIKPTLSTLFTLKKQIADSEQLDKNLETKINSLLEVQEEFQGYKEDLNLVKEALPTYPQVPNLLRKIEGLAKEQGIIITDLQVEGFKLQEKTTSDGPLSFTFLLSIAGDYPQVEGFLKKLLNLRRIIALEELKFSLDQEQKINLALKGKSYYFSKP